MDDGHQARRSRRVGRLRHDLAPPGRRGFGQPSVDHGAVPVDDARRHDDGHLSAAPDQATAGDVNAHDLGAVLGANSLLLLDGDRHLEARRLMLPPFHGERLRTHAELLVSTPSYAEVLAQVDPDAAKTVLGSTNGNGSRPDTNPDRGAY